MLSVQHKCLHEYFHSNLWGPTKHRPGQTGPIIYNNNFTLFRPGPTLVPEVYFYYFHCEGRKLIH